MTYSTQGIKSLPGAFCLAVALSALAGCSMGTMQLSGPAPIGSVAVNLSGVVHGGQQPVSGATVQLYAVGSGTYGAAASALGSAVTSGSDGSFTLTGTYTCPSTGNGLVYLLAKGGNPGLTSGTNNTALAMAAPLGACSSLSSSTVIQVNEITTAATAYALGQYFTPTFGSSSTDSFGAPSSAQAQTGITNAFATAATLVNTTTGNANQSVPLTGAGGTLTAVPEYLKLETVADILASCINSTGVSDPGGACATLFADVYPNGATAPTDTLQAAVYMSLNPTSNSAANVTALYGLSTANPPYPELGSTSAPTDWTLGIQYQDATAAILNDPQNIAADSNGNIWVASYDGTTDDVAELSGTAPGTPLFAGSSFTISGTAVSFAGIDPRNLAIDTNNNVWFTTSSSSGIVFEYNPTSDTAYDYATGKAAYGLAINGNNDVFVGQESSSAAYELYEFPGGNTSEPVGYPIAAASGLGTSGTNSYLTPEYMGFDTSGNLWMTNGSNSPPTSKDDIVELTGIPSDASLATTCAGTYPCILSSATYTTFTGYTSPWAVAATTGGSMWVANEGGDGVYLQPSTGATTEYDSSLSAAHFDAVDGSGNVWVTAKSSSIVELNSAGTALSPASGYPHAGYAADSLGVTIDPSGNVWVASNSSSTPTSVFELVGAAAPTVTPIAEALATSKVAARP